ncbi:MAG: FecR domain-containing protein [Pyrinomonadaceae bacterium]
MNTRTTRFTPDWWVIQKRAIYVIILMLALCVIAAGAALYVWKYGNPLKNLGATTNLTGARFISFEGDVRVLRATTREVISANSNTQLFPGDTVQTQADGRARISMADGSTVVVRPNSTIIIRDNARAEDGKKTNVHVVVDSGQMSVRTEQQPDGANNVVETAKTQNKIGQETNASFGISPEGSEEIRVAQGAVQSTNRSGDRTDLKSGEYVSINSAGTISKPQRLLDVPLPSEPRDLEKVTASTNGSATIGLRWQRPQSGTATYYRVEVATSPFFVPEGRVIERDQLVATEFSASDLRPGVYFWRLRATAASGQVSDWSEPRKFIVAPRGTGSSVSVSNLSYEYVGGDIYLVRGSALPGTTLRVAGRETVATSDGSFQLQITAPSGAQTLTIEAQDPQGNSSQYRLSIGSAQSRSKR